MSKEMFLKLQDIEKIRALKQNVLGIIKIDFGGKENE